MKLEINEIYHNYIIKIVIFAVFLYKNMIRQPSTYKLTVLSFVKKRIPWNINLKIDTGIRLDKDEEREIILKELLDDIKSDYLTNVVVTFNTPIKEVTMDIDLSDENKYEDYLYS